MATRLVSAARTDVGLKRSNNEDNYILVPSQGLYVLADGMGGHASGQVASTMCVQHVTQFICETAKQANFELPYAPNSALSYDANVLANAVKFANERVFIQSCKDRSMEGMGTTVTVILNVAHGLVLAHVGDSRIYRIRNKQITQMSRDHSLLNHLLDKGEIRPEDVAHFANKNVILRAIGLKDSVDVEVKEVQREQGDIYLMCSDGLSDLVTDTQILNAITNSPNLNEACDKLIALALKAGGKDNVTVVCICIELEDGYNATPRSVNHMQGQPGQGQPGQGQPGQGQASHPSRPQPDAPSMRQPATAQAPHGPNTLTLAPQNNKIARSNMPPAPPNVAAPIVAQSTREHSVREPIQTHLDAVEDMQNVPRPVRGSASAMPAPPKVGRIQSNLLDPLETGPKLPEMDDRDEDEDDETMIHVRPEFIHEISGTLQEARPSTGATGQVPQPPKSNQNLIPAPLSSPKQPAASAGLAPFSQRAPMKTGHRPPTPAHAVPAPPQNPALLQNSSQGLPHTAQTKDSDEETISLATAQDSVPPIPNYPQTQENYIAPRRISRISKKEDEDSQEPILSEMPSTELLLTKAPMAVEDFKNANAEDKIQLDDERTILELPVLDEHFLNALREQETKRAEPPAQAAHVPPFGPPSKSANASQPGVHHDPIPIAKRPEARHNQTQNSDIQPSAVKLSSPATPTYVPPKGAIKAPVFDYDDDDDSIEIDASLLTASDERDVTQIAPRPPRKI